MKCIFCNIPLKFIHLEEFHCIDCKSMHLYRFNNLNTVSFKYDKYYIYFNFIQLNCSIYLLNKMMCAKVIYTFDYIPNITPKNIESKLNTILALL